MSLKQKLLQFTNSSRLLEVPLYPIKFVKNSISILLNYGPNAFIQKAKLFIKQKTSLEKKYDENVEFRKWLKNYNAKKLQPEKRMAEIANFKYQPKISIILPIYNPPKEFLSKAIESIKAQYYTNWEICMSNDSTEEWVEPFLKDLATSDPNRIKFNLKRKRLHICGNSNAAAGLATGEYLLLMDNDDELTENALYEYVKFLNKRPEANLIYTDEYKIDFDGRPCEPWFRISPSQELDYSMSQIVHFLMRKELFEKAGRFVEGTEGAQDYDLHLRIRALTDKVYHVPEMTYKWRKTKTSTSVTVKYKPYAARNAKKVIESELKRRKIGADLVGETYPFRIKPKIKGSPSTEIIVPTKNLHKYLRMTIDSIRKFTKTDNYSITIIDHESDDPQTLKYLEQLQSTGVNIIKYKGLYNFSEMNNIAARKSKAEFLVFMNNDIKIVTRGWLGELISWAQQPAVGPVGTMLLYPDGRVQHAGIILGVGGVAAHAYWMELESSTKYFGQLHLVRNYSAVTAALMAIERKKFLEVGGFNNKELKVAYNDIDLCLRMTQKGYRTVYTPHAKSLHFESITRDTTKIGRRPTNKEENYMLQEWESVIKNDPFYNINFAHKFKEGELLKTYHIRP